MMSQTALTDEDIRQSRRERLEHEKVYEQHYIVQYLKEFVRYTLIGLLLPVLVILIYVQASLRDGGVDTVGVFIISGAVAAIYVVMRWFARHRDAWVQMQNRSVYRRILVRTQMVVVFLLILGVALRFVSPEQGGVFLWSCLLTDILVVAGLIVPARRDERRLEWAFTGRAGQFFILHGRKPESKEELEAGLRGYKLP